MEELKVKVQVVVHIEETEDFDDSEWSDTESVKSFGTMTYSEKDSGIFGSLSDISTITEIPNDCHEQKYKLLQDELDMSRNKVVDLELKNNKLVIAEELYVKQMRILMEQNQSFSSTEEKYREIIKYYSLQQEQLGNATTKSDLIKVTFSEVNEAFTNVCTNIKDEVIENVKTQMETFKEVSESCDNCDKCDKCDKKTMEKGF